MKEYLQQFCPHPPSKSIKSSESAELAELIQQYERSGGSIKRIEKTNIKQRRDDEFERALLIRDRHNKKLKKMRMMRDKMLTMPDGDAPDGWVTSRQAAWIIGVRPDTLNRMVNSGKFPDAEGKQRRAWIWTRETVEKWLDKKQG